MENIQWPERKPLELNIARKDLTPLIQRLESVDYSQLEEWALKRTDESLQHWTDNDITDYFRYTDVQVFIKEYAAKHCPHFEDRLVLSVAFYGEIRLRYDKYAAPIHQYLFFTLATYVFDIVKASNPGQEQLSQWYYEYFYPELGRKEQTMLVSNESSKKIIWKSSLTNLAEWLAKLKLRGYIQSDLSNPQLAQIFSTIFLLQDGNGTPQPITNMESFQQLIKEKSSTGNQRKQNPEFDEMDEELRSSDLE